MPETPIEQMFTDNQAVVEYLSKSRLLNPLPNDLLKRLAPHFRVKHFPATTDIAEISQNEALVYFLVRGKIAIYSHGNLILKLKRLGDMCGDMSFITDKSCSTCEVADTAVDLVGLNMSDIFDSGEFSLEEIKQLMYQLFTSMLLDKLTICCGKASEVSMENEQLHGVEQLLSETRKELGRANEVKNNFLANISHEIRTPMHGVLGMTSLLLNSALSEQQREYAKTIERSASAFLNVINDILDFSKLDAGEYEIQNGPFDLKKLIDKAIQEMSETACAKNLNLYSTVCEKTPLLLRGDSIRIHQVLINLISNGIKFTEEGEVKLLVDVLTHLENRVKIRFTIKDSGIGISQEDRTSLFKSFSQVDPSLTRKYGGTGLGLVISKQLVEAMGGVIGFESSIGNGSTFWFSLELEKQPDRRKMLNGNLPTDRYLTRESDTLKPIRLQEKKQVRILLVTHNRIKQIIILLTLEKLGYSAKVAEGGTEAINALSTAEYDIVLMDIKMPDMSGFQAATLIRDPNSPILSKGIPIIAITDHVLDSNRSKCLKKGMNDCLSTPISDDDLELAIQRWSTIRQKDKIDFTTMDHRFKNYIDLTILERLKRNLGDIDTLIHLFLREIPNILNKIEKAILFGDISELERAAHSMKSNCLTFGALEMADIALELEKMGCDGDLATAKQSYEKLWDASRKVIDFFERLLQADSV